MSDHALRPGAYSLGFSATGGCAVNYNYVDRFTYDGIIHSSSAPITLREYSGSLHVGTILTSPRGKRLLRGELELDADLVPVWIAHYPPQVLVYSTAGQSGTSSTGLFHPQTRYGISVTPLQVRWDFTASRRFVPWAQLGGGLLWTNHKFPQYPVDTANTSVINFTPQFGVGANLFVRPRQSLSFAVNAVHISSASLGDTNPGINISAQFSVGYNWWK